MLSAVGLSCFGFSPLAHAVLNGDFERLPNISWLTDGPNVPRRVQGDRPSIPVAPNGNHYGHIGDHDGIPAHGESHSRIFQWSDCADTTTIAPDCVISFRFKTLLLAGEVAWVRTSGPAGQIVHAIPHSNNQWANVRMQIAQSGGCVEPPVYVEFGMLSRQGNAIGGRLNIDDVRHRCDQVEMPPPGDEDWDLLPGIPEEGSGEPIPEDRQTMKVVPRDGRNTIALLLVASMAIFLWRLKRSSK